MVSEAATDEQPGPPVKAELLDLLVCPSCRNPLANGAGHLACRGCGLRYPLRDGIPVMLVSEAVPTERTEEGSEGS
jgi:uncharacterized protein YbaR (Trm112 family)